MIQNRYRIRKVITDKPCFICHKQTRLCLGNEEPSEFVYTCLSHLSDPGFATAILPTPPIVSQREIDNAIRDYNSSKTTTAKPVPTSWLSTISSGASSIASATISTLAFSGEPPVETVKLIATIEDLPSRDFILHRRVFEMRLGIRQKRGEVKEMKERKIPDLPRVPRGGF